MKVLFVIEAAFNPRGGGVQHTSYKLGKYFSEKGLDVCYFSFSKEEHINPVYGILYHGVEEGRSESSRNIEYLQNVLHSFKPDIVINQHPYAASIRSTIFSLQDELCYTILGCLRNSLFNFKNNASFIVKEMLEGLPLKLVDNPIGLRFVQAYHFIKHRRDLKKILDEHDFFILLAPPNQEDLEYFVGKYKAEKVRAIPNSIPKVFEPCDKEKILLYVGRLDVKQKRADLLAPIWQKLYKKLPDWRFIVVGDGPYKENLDQEIQELNLPRIETTGRKDPEEYYQEASILVMPSAFEGFPNVLLEAQSHGVAPVLFDSYSSVSWVVEDGKDAFLAEPFCIEEIADRVEQLAKNSDVLRKMSEASNNNAQRFTINKVGKMWLDFFEELE